MVRLDDDARRLLDGANYGHLSTLMADGSPKVEPVWVGLKAISCSSPPDAKAIKASTPRISTGRTVRRSAYDTLRPSSHSRQVVGDPRRRRTCCMARCRRIPGASFPRTAIGQARRTRLATSLAATASRLFVTREQLITSPPRSRATESQSSPCITLPSLVDRRRTWQIARGFEALGPVTTCAASSSRRGQRVSQPA